MTDHPPVTRYTACELLRAWTADRGKCRRQRSWYGGRGSLTSEPSGMGGPAWTMATRSRHCGPDHNAGLGCGKPGWGSDTGGGIPEPPGGPPGGVPRGPPRGGPRGAPRAPGGVHFRGYLITLPVGTKWDTGFLAPRDRVIQGYPHPVGYTPRYPPQTPPDTPPLGTPLWYCGKY